MQRDGKHIPTNPTSSRIGRLLLSNGPVNTHPWQEKTVFSVESLHSGYKKCSAGQEKKKQSCREYGRELARVLEMRAQDDWEEMAKKQLNSDK
jgi:hypothetical protein